MSDEFFSSDQQISSDGNFENFNAEEQDSLPQGNGAGDSGDVEDDGTDDSRKLFVGGLSWETTEKDLKEYFSKWGEVKTCTIKVDRFTGHSRGFGFVIFEQEESVNKALAIKEHRLNNKQIDPKRAKPTREPQKKIFVGGLDPDVTEEQIKEYFGKFGKIESLDLPFDNQKGKRKAYIFVTYTSESEAKKASKEEKQDIFGKRCDVRVAVPREQANRQKAYQWGPSWGGQGGYVPYGYGYDYSYGPGYDYSYGAGAGYGYGGYGAYDYGFGRGGYGGGGKIRGRGAGPGGNGAAAAPASNMQGYHPYNRQ